MLLDYGMFFRPSPPLGIGAWLEKPYFTGCTERSRWWRSFRDNSVGAKVERSLRQSPHQVATIGAASINT